MPAARALRALKVQLARAALVRRRPVVRRPKRLPRQLPAKGAELHYLQALRAYVAGARSLVENLVLRELSTILLEAERERGDAAREDARGTGRLLELMDKARAEFKDRYPAKKLEELGEEVARRTSAHQRGELHKQIRAAIGVDVLALPEPGLPRRIADFTSENVSLIQSISSTAFDQVERTLLSGVSAGKRHEEIAQEVQERFEVSESRAALIARDQVSKFSAELNESRQTALGVGGYIWRTVADNRVRDEHHARDGKRFSWDSPPADGHPGEPVNCRCYADPDLSELLDQL